MKQQTMRDSFWDRIYELAKDDRDILIVSADLAAPALDRFREDLPEQFISVGISEQNAILVATGFALTGKKPIVYAITEFITERCYEQIRLYPCGMNLPVTIVGAGAGTSYWESGATHQCWENISVMRILPHMDVWNCSDQIMARALGDIAVDGNGPKFIQLDRNKICDLHDDGIKLELGFDVLRPICKVNIAATGIMSNEAYCISNLLEKENISIGVIDCYRMPLREHDFVDLLPEDGILITLEENLLDGGFGSYILELLNRQDLFYKVKRMGFDAKRKGYGGCYNYAGRDAIRGEYGFSSLDIANCIKKQFN